MRVRFGDRELDSETRQLFVGGKEVHLHPKAFQFLELLLENRPKAVSKNAIHEKLWPGTFVSDGTLASLVVEVRHAIGDDAHQSRLVRTVHRFGYAFCGDAIPLPDSVDAVPVRVWCVLEADGRRFPLASGEYVIGRDADVEIRFDTSTVSRRHARVVVTVDAAVLEDCGSKNGTFRGGERVSSPVALIDGDTIRMGSVVATFRVSAAFQRTETHEEVPPCP